MSNCSLDGCESPVRFKRLCDRHYRQDYNSRTRERQLELKRARYRKNREQRLAEMREYYARNRAAFREKGQRFRAKNPGYTHEYYQEHREHIAAWNKAWRAAHPGYYNARSARRRQQGQVGMTAEDRRLSLEWRASIADDPCCYCGELAEEMHDDHVIPLARGGTDHWWNLVRACRACNLRKGAKTADEFIAAMEGVANEAAADLHS